MVCAFDRSGTPRVTARTCCMGEHDAMTLNRGELSNETSLGVGRGRVGTWTRRNGVEPGDAAAGREDDRGNQEGGGEEGRETQDVLGGEHAVRLHREQLRRQPARR